MYRGLGPTILGYLPTWAIYFAFYDGIKTIFGAPPQAIATAQERLYPAPQVKGYQPLAREHPWSLHILSAMAAGAASTICTNPLWVIKTRFMVPFYCVLECVTTLLTANPCDRRSLDKKSNIDTPSTLPLLFIEQKAQEHFIVAFSQVSLASHMLLFNFRCTNN